MTGQPTRTRKLSSAAIRAAWQDLSVTKEEAAARLGISGRYLQQLASAMGLPHRPGYVAPRSDIDPVELARMWRAGLATKDIAEAFGVFRNTVRRHAEMAGLQPRHRGFTGKISLTEYRQRQMAARLSDSAAETRAALRMAEMTDRKAGNWISA